MAKSNYIPFSFMKRIALFCFCLLLTGQARADEWTGTDVMLIISGILAGQVTHEGGHYITAKVLGADDVQYHGLSVTHKSQLSRHGEYQFASAGFVFQNILSELALTHQEKRGSQSYFALGVVAWNFVEQVTYRFRIKEPESDIDMMSANGGLSSSQVWAFLVIKSSLDLYRWHNPTSKVAITTSGTMLGGMMVGFVIDL